VIVGISGLAGAGKSTAAAMLVALGYAQVSMADPFKRVAADWFDWDPYLLWGESKQRSFQDPRYGGLTPRRALQVLGTEVGRLIYRDIWALLAVRTARRLLTERNVTYSEETGIVLDSTLQRQVTAVVIPDVRHENEIRFIRAYGGKKILVRLKRGWPKFFSRFVPKPIMNLFLRLHSSELEQLYIPDSEFDIVIDNRDMTVSEMTSALRFEIDKFLRTSGAVRPR